MAAIVLIHGGWHGGWCWRKLVPFLRTSGHDVYAPTLTGVGERSHLISPDIDLSCHIQDVVNVLTYENLENVILVGHSYGGMVITGAADKCPERLSQLVYLDAWVPENGQSASDQMSDPAILERLSDKGLLPPLSPEAMGVTDPDDVKWMMERLIGHPLRTLTERLQLSSPSTDRLVRTYISCTVDQGHSIAKTAARIREESGWRYLELETGHDAMITTPQELANIIDSIV